jgi:hypothetical protein
LLRYNRFLLHLERDKTKILPAAFSIDIDTNIEWGGGGRPLQPCVRHACGWSLGGFHLPTPNEGPKAWVANDL